MLLPYGGYVDGMTKAQILQHGQSDIFCGLEIELKGCSGRVYRQA